MTHELGMNLLRRQNVGDNLRLAVKATGEKHTVIFEFCRGRLPGFEAPKRIHFRSSLQISAANKILKKDLKTEYANADKGG